MTLLIIAFLYQRALEADCGGIDRLDRVCGVACVPVPGLQIVAAADTQEKVGQLADADFRHIAIVG